MSGGDDRMPTVHAIMAHVGADLAIKMSQEIAARIARAVMLGQAEAFETAIEVIGSYGKGPGALKMAIDELGMRVRACKAAAER